MTGEEIVDCVHRFELDDLWMFTPLPALSLGIIVRVVLDCRQCFFEMASSVVCLHYTFSLLRKRGGITLDIVSSEEKSQVLFLIYMNKLD